ncbi:hypothetical protein [Halolactibacillus sp. JCM 19043]|uniref:hypothetical protein n=1 Tax=Halolactibacillus sp. JCM 19043 TaxID=1460638 RepID=UPI001E39E6AF|nr:hypothetical protein [Halolactibacillus sp. JCM 19043]
MAQKMTKFKSVAMISSGLLIGLALIFNLIGKDYFIDPILIVATVLTGIPVVYFALQALRMKYMSIDLLVSIAIIGAIFIGEYVESSVVGFLFLFGSYLEARTLARTRQSIQSLMALAPEEATLLKDGQEVVVSVSDVALNDIVIVKAGGRSRLMGILFQVKPN